MYDRIGPVGSSYFHLLDYSTQKHYLMKLKVNGHDLKHPYDVPDKLWLDDPSKWPEIQFGGIYTYLIEIPGIFTKENLRAYKSLEACNYFIMDMYTLCTTTTHVRKIVCLKHWLIPAKD